MKKRSLKPQSRKTRAKSLQQAGLSLREIARVLRCSHQTVKRDLDVTVADLSGSDQEGGVEGGNDPVPAGCWEQSERAKASQAPATSPALQAQRFRNAPGVAGIDAVPGICAASDACAAGQAGSDL